MLDEKKEKKRAKNARYREKNREVLRQKEKDRYHAMKEKDPEGFAEKERIRSREYRAEHSQTEKYKEEARARANRNYEKIKNCPIFKEKNRAKAACWYLDNTDRAIAYSTKRASELYKNDSQFRERIKAGRRTYMAIKHEHKKGRAIDELGCSAAEAREHIENQFSEGMTWENWSHAGWHIDHKKPLCSFDMLDPEQLKIALHYTNLQPLWSEDNLKKGGRSAE